MGLATVRHYCRLLPLVLPWCCAPDPHTQLPALHLLRVIVQQTWPRISVHAAVLQGALDTAEEENVGRGANDTTSTVHSCITSELACVRQMVQACRQSEV